MIADQELIKTLKGPIVVFGAGGFIGANLLHQLAQWRTDCIGVTHQHVVPWRLKKFRGTVETCDIRQRDQVEILFNKHKFQTIFCYSAYGAYEKQDTPQMIYETNVIGLVNVIEVASSLGFCALVHAGSSSEYGFNCEGPDENALLKPNSHYSVSKISTSYLVQYYGKVLNKPIVHLRFYSIYGPYEDPGRLVPKLVSAGLENGYPPLVNKAISRDFVYVDDALTASYLAATRGVASHKGECFNIASSKKTTIEEIAHISKKVFNISSNPTWGSMEERRWDMANWYGSNAKAMADLQWSPKVSLEEGLARTAQWMRSPDRAYPAEQASISRKISAIIACYMDAQAIPIMCERLSNVFTKLGLDYEIIFVNDGSPDDTHSVLVQLTQTNPKVLAIEHSRNFGSQSAFLSGMAIANGDAVVLLDGDLQDPPELIEDFVEKWNQGYDVVYGRRVKRDAALLLQICYKAFYRLFQKMSYVKIPLDAGDFSLISARVVKHLLQLPETDQYLRGLRAWLGFRQTGVDYIRPERMFGTSTNNWRKNIWWARKAIFSFSFAPLEMLFYAGLCLTGLSFLAFFIQISAAFIDPSIPRGIPTLIVLILFFGGVNIFSISILGEYLGKTIEEVKGRPRYVRANILALGRHYSTSDEMDTFLKSREKGSKKNVFVC